MAIMRSALLPDRGEGVDKQSNKSENKITLDLTLELREGCELEIALRNEE